MTSLPRTPYLAKSSWISADEVSAGRFLAKIIVLDRLTGGLLNAYGIQ